MPERTPWVGLIFTAYVTESPSGSEPVNVIGSAVFSFVDTD